MNKKITLIATTCFILPVVCFGNEAISATSKQVTIDAHGISKATRQASGGRIYELKAIYHGKKYSSLFSSAASYMNLKFGNSKSEALRCFNMKDDKTIDYITGHIICGQMISRIFFINGKYAEWSKFTIRLKKDASPIFRQRVPSSKGRPLAPFNAYDYVKFLNWPNTSIKYIKGTNHRTRLEWNKVGPEFENYKSYKLPFIDININGEPVKAIIDTGAPMLLIPSYMAKRLRIKKISEGRNKMSTAYDRDIHATIGRAEEVDMAGVRFNNVMTIVADVPYAIVGLAQLMKLHKLEVGRKYMTVIVNSYAFPHCPNKMYIGGYLSGALETLRMTAMIDGKIEHPVLDTGLNYTFQQVTHTMTNGLGRKRPGYDAAGKKNLVGYERNAIIGTGKSSQNVHGSVILDQKNEKGYVFGSQLIKKVGPLYLDFDTGHACFIKQEP